MQVNKLKWLLITLAITLLSAPTITAAQQPSSAGTATTALQDLDIISPRPLNDALSIIEAKLKVPIDFEEAPLTDPSSTVLGEQIGLRPGVRYPKGGHLVVQFISGETNAVAAVQTALSAYEHIGISGKYGIRQEDGAILVFPISSKTPIAETAITITDGIRTIADTLQLIAAKISSASGAKVQILNQPFVLGETVDLASQREPAIDVLRRMSRSLVPLSFRFIYDPSEKSYYLNVNAISTFSPTVSPEPRKQPIIKTAPSSSPYFIKTK